MCGMFLRLTRSSRALTCLPTSGEVRTARSPSAKSSHEILSGVSADSFDFWLGTWDVTWDGEGGQVEAGINSVTRVDDTIRELFTAPDPAGAYIGASVSRWDADAECWRQDYWDNRGYSAIFQGSRSADRMILERIPGPGPGPLTRLVWSDIAPAAILWNYERQNADGSWESTWRIRYARQDTGGASATL
jgi:hypothetical protein